MSSDQTIADLGEFGLIDEIVKGIGTSEYVLLGPGDDAAHIATADGTFLASTDLLIEGQHFRRDWSSAEDIGRKSAAANLSDINAMGGVATALTVGFAAPADLPVQWVRDFWKAFESECAQVGAHVVGGDISKADLVVISVTAFGDAERPIARSGAKPGDVVAYAGQLGLAAAGFAALSRGFRSPKIAVDAHRAPQPPYSAGPAAAEAGATAMIDVSDGFLADIGHIAQASGVSIDVETSAFKIADEVNTLAGALGAIDPLTFVLTGGEDFALAATFPADAKLPEGWIKVGTVSSGSGVTVNGAEFTGKRGHRHFS